MSAVASSVCYLFGFLFDIEDGWMFFRNVGKFPGFTFRKTELLLAIAVRACCPWVVTRHSPGSKQTVTLANWQAAVCSNFPPTARCSMEKWHFLRQQKPLTQLLHPGFEFPQQLQANVEIVGA
jgi:hypothetical protein